MTPTITIRDLRVQFDTSEGPFLAIQHLNTTFLGGRICGVIGESGSGKSVLAMSILRLLPKTAHVDGTCLFGTEDIYAMPAQRLRALRGASIGLIPQNPTASLNPVLKIGAQLTEAIRLHRGLSREQGTDDALRMLARFGFEHPKDILKGYAFQMSGGMNQRVVSALGAAPRPAWIIADEPTKGLDTTLRHQVYRTLKHIFDTHKTSLLLITHDLALAAELCHDLRVLYRGRIVESGATQSILDQPLHPYTAGLIASHPRRGLIPMQPPIVSRIPHQGCDFYPRCPKALPRCGVEIPEEVDLEGERKVRCFLYG